MTKTKTTDIAVEFAQASQLKDIEYLKYLLHDNGEFEIQNDHNEDIVANKNEFIKWYETKLSYTPITDILYDQCLNCHFGNSVVIFNDGKFPRSINDSSQRSKTGLMIDTKDGKIFILKFCFVFLKTENKYEFECIGEKIKKYMDEGLSFKKAFKKVKEAK